MAVTPNFGLPLIGDNTTNDVKRDMNALATAVDTALAEHDVEVIDSVTSTDKTKPGSADAVRRAYELAASKETPTGAQTKANTAETNAKNASLPRTGGTISGALAVQGELTFADGGTYSSLKQSVVDGKGSIETIIKGKGGSVSKAGSVATFPELVAGVNTLKGSGSILGVQDLNPVPPPPVVTEYNLAGGSYPQVSSGSGIYIDRKREKVIVFNYNGFQVFNLVGMVQLYRRIGLSGGSVCGYDPVHGYAYYRISGTTRPGRFDVNTLTEEDDWGSGLPSSDNSGFEGVFSGLEGNIVLASSNYLYKLDRNGVVLWSKPAPIAGTYFMNESVAVHPVDGRIAVVTFGGSVDTTTRIYMYSKNGVQLGEPVTVASDARVNNYGEIKFDKYGYIYFKSTYPNTKLTIYRTNATSIISPPLTSMAGTDERRIQSFDVDADGNLYIMHRSQVSTRDSQTSNTVLITEVTKYNSLYLTTGMFQTIWRILDYATSASTTWIETRMGLAVEVNTDRNTNEIEFAYHHRDTTVKRYTQQLTLK
ncbi:hypothetical protein M3231_15080 [Neobacillus mesonae]|nr:hypothetical protein [Neobacillus mesonae]